MKKMIMMVAIAAACTTSYGQDFNKTDKSALDAAYYPAKATKMAFAKTEEAKKALKPKIRVLYSRPMKKGRNIFGDLVKFNNLWRLGANESTEILFMTDVKVGGKDIKAGRYTLFVVPSAKEWMLKINTDLDGWGHYAYNAENDVASIAAPVQKSKDEIEALSIALYEKSTNTVHLKIGWDDTVVEFPITLK